MSPDHKHIEARSHVALSSLLRLRWGVYASLLLAAAVAFFVLELELPRARVLGLIGSGAVSNALLSRWRTTRQVTQNVAGAVLLLDVLLLTALLHASGGANNPFSVLYLIYVIQAAVMLDRSWIWTITGVAAVGYAVQFFVGDPHAAHHQGGYVQHLQGMWIAFAVAAALMAYHVGRLSHEVREREREVLQLREQAARNERLVALTTLAAGAAHELNTPLGTVALIARELERRAEPNGAGARIGEDARMIRREIERCRGIIEQMIAQSGDSVGEAPELIGGERLVDELTRALPPGLAARLEVKSSGVDAVSAPPRALVRVLGNLVKNAFDASGESAKVTLAIAREGEIVRFTVRDEGTGMSREIAERAVEPFFTTKSSGKGLGLGLFLVQSFADRMGGRLTIDSAPGRGTSVHLELRGNDGGRAHAATSG